ncbi:MAG TPA: glycosyltransferase family A protein [Patescibacteria group bacterium]|nr:glycosyltransferase family A protein [Patescibacteria group bacterium]
MKVSIVVPAYNEEGFLPRCLNSIFSSDLPDDFEVIVVNNASTDKTEMVAKNFKGVKVVNELKKGVTRARQAGYLASSGEILVFFDADSIVSKNWFNIVIKKFVNDSELIGISGPYHFEKISKTVAFFESIYNNIIMPVGEKIWKYVFRQGGIMLIGGNFAVRREALEKIGGFNTNLEFYGEDTELTRRIAKIGKIEFSKELVIGSSLRRFGGEGGLKLIAKYVINFFSEWIFKKPLNKIYQDFR